ncbi:MAG: PKD domain-containing protein [Chitinophagales bacterium]
MKKTVTIFILALLFHFNIDAKNQPTNTPKVRCSSDAPSIESEVEFQQKIQEFLAQQNAGNRLTANYTIPVIVHVIYWNAVENISDAQVNSQIDILNADYAGTGYNVNTCPAAFQPLISNTNISFCKAVKKPNGTQLSVAGVERINAQTAGFTNPGTGSGSGWTKSYIDGTVKPATIWDPTKYMNIWVLPLQDGLLGYATFPVGTGLTGITGNGTATTDGVVIGYLYYGNTGTVSAPYNKGRTATHEIGHWLGLRHISGDSDCGDDFCGDTPLQSGNAGDGQGLNYGCPTFPSVTCSNGPNGDLFQNFMDYTDDACMFLFTPNQRTRIQTAMANGTYRAPLASSTVCTATSAVPVADFSADRVSICPGNSVKFTDLTTGIPTSWSWSFTGGTPSTSIAQNPTVTYSAAGTYAVTLTATNSLGSDAETKTAYINVGNPTTTALPIVQGFETTPFPPTGWVLASTSSFAWERSTAAGGFGASTASMVFNNTDDDAAGSKDDIYTPAILYPTNAVNPRIKFDVAYAPYVDAFGQVNDTLEVLISDICAGTLTSIYKKGGNQLSTASAQGGAFTPTAAQWRKDSVTVSNTFLNKSIRFVFRNYGLYGHEIYVDNVNIYATVTNTTTPTASFTATDTSVCQGSNLSFTSTSTSGNATAVDSVRWTINGGTPSTATSTSVTSTFNTAGTYTVRLVAYEGGVASAAAIKAIVVKPLPTVAAITGAASVCVNSTTTYSSTTAGGIWSSSATGIATVNANGVVSGVSPGSAEIRYTVTSNGCSTMVTKVITVNALPTVAAITGAASVCVNSTTTYSSTTAGGTWSSSATGIATVNANGVVSGVSPGTAEIRYTVTSNGCSTMVTKVITVNALPTVAAITGAASVCVNSTTTYSSTTAGGTWSSSATGIATVNANGVVGGVSPGTAEIRYTVTSNGCSTMVAKVITVNALPTVAAITGAASVCVNSTTTYSSTTAGGTWSSSATGIATVNANGVVSGVSPGTAEIRYTVTSNGCSTMVTKVITVNAIPAVTVNSPTICPNTSATLTAGGANTYTWTGGLTGNPATTPVLTSSTTYVVTGTANGCTKSATATVTVNSTPPTVVISPRDPSVCLGDVITLSVSGANSYTWTPGNTTGSTYIFTPSATTKVKVQGTSGTCSNPGYDSVTVSIKPKPTVSVSSPTICAGQTATIQANGASTYTWSGGLTGNPATTGVLTANTNYTVTGTLNGCTGTAVSNVTVNLLPATPTITRRNDTVFSSVTGTQYKWYLNNVLLTTTTTAFLKVTQNGLYKVEVVGANTCVSAASANISVTLTGVKYNKLDIQLAIVPNPNNGLFEIRITSKVNKTYQLKLFNVAGQIITDEEMNIRAGENSKNINLNGIEKGVYFLSIIGEDGIATQSIMIQ